MASSKTSTLAQTATDALREMITRGDFRPGERLTAQMLADRLGVSRTPVNDALALLHREGFLDYGVNRGYSVRPIDLKAILDAFDVRIALEGLASRTVAEKGLSRVAESALRANQEAARELLFSPTTPPDWRDAWRPLNVEFHDIILDEAANSLLSWTVRAARAVPLPRTASAGVGAVEELWPHIRLQSSQDALRDHVRIFEMLRRGEAARAEALMKEHVSSGRDKVREAASVAVDVS